MNYRYAVDRYDGKRLDLCDTRHEAVGRMSQYQNESWYDVTAIPRSQCVVRLPRREQPRVANDSWPSRYEQTEDVL